MALSTSLACHEPKRRADLRLRGPNGIDYIEVSEDNTRLNVYLFCAAPVEIGIDNVLITGLNAPQLRVTDLRLCMVDDPERDDCLQITIDRPGNASTYTLRLAALDKEGQPTDSPLEGFDPIYAQADFRFLSRTGGLVDCKQSHPCDEAVGLPPVINYLAKDYGTFLQLILDRLALTMPGWQETHEPDIGVVLVEVLAYVADYLSYYQDAVATEAYLATARQRISVRRHVRLVNYPMHDGCNSRAWVYLTASQDVTNPPLDPLAVSFLAAYNGPNPPAETFLTMDQLAAMRNGQYLIFQSVASQPLSIYAAHNRVSFYTWGDQLCCLPTGTTRAALLDQEPASSSSAAKQRILHLQAGDVLLFEEVIGPGTGSPADADPSHRHFVRLTAVKPTVDAAYETNVLEIQWAVADALPFPLCLSAIGPAPSCANLAEVSVARGNAFLVDHGAWVMNELLGTVPLAATRQLCEGVADGAEIEVDGGTFQPALQQGPLTLRVPLKPSAPASDCLIQDPRNAVSEINLTSIPGLPDGSGPLFTFDELQNPAKLAARLANAKDIQSDNLRGEFSAATLKKLATFDSARPAAKTLDAISAEMQTYLRSWTPQRDLLSSSSEDFHYVVEIDDDGVAHLRFGDGECGRAAEAGETFSASYRIGSGAAGNVGAEAISQTVLSGTVLNGMDLTPRNPLAAQGGTDPEPIDQVKLCAPGASQKQLQRAITADDYAALAQNNPKVQRAAAELQWTGTGYEVHVAIDPLGTENVDLALLSEIQSDLYVYRRIGHEVTVVPPSYVPLDIAMTVTLHPGYARSQLQPMLLSVFSARALAGGATGFFHPDNLTFGGDIYLSALVASAQEVTGVQQVTVTRLQRLFAGANHELESGVLPIGPLEVARLDNDPARPENGRFVLDLRGGR
jgi:hypothetical protein